MAESPASNHSASPDQAARRRSSSHPEPSNTLLDSPAGSRQMQVATGTAPPACDACRSRKVKCTPLDVAEQETQAARGSGIKCKLCVKRNEACKYDYVYKKPGRPVGSTKRPRRSASPDNTVESPGSIRQRQRTSMSQPGDELHPPSSSGAGPSPHVPFYSNYPRLIDSRSNSPRFDYNIPTGSSTSHSYSGVSRPAAAAANLDVNEQGALPAGFDATLPAHNNAGPASGTIFGSALSAMHSDHAFSDLFPNPFASASSYDSGQNLGHGYDQQQAGQVPDGGFGRSTAEFYPGGDGLMPGIVVDLGPNLQPASWQNGTGSGVPSDNRSTKQQMPSRPHRPWTDRSSASQPAPNARRSGSAHTLDAPPSSYLPPTAAPTPGGSGSFADSPKVPHPATRPDIPQIESVAPWQDICFFLSLHMKHQHGLMPLVHKPSFALDVLQRRDTGDEVFRGLLCSIVSYTICQLPIQLTATKYSRTELEMLLRRCQRTSRAIQLRWHMAPCLESLASLQLDTNTALGCTQLDLATALISDIRRQVYSLGLHKAEPREGLDFLQIQICRRLFWEIYQSDKTNVMNAISPISLNDLEGVPPLPLEIDDDYLTTSTSTPQPSGRISYMTGFVAVSRIFEILGQCQIRQRTWSNNPDAGPGRTELSRWVDDNQVKMRDILHELPKALRAEGGSKDKGGFERADESSLGIQRANIHITALCVDFALLDFKVHLRPELDTKAEREHLAQKAYKTLSSVPIEYLASNGESMRGKVLRIVLDLLSHCPEPGIFGQDVWNWWNMYSQVQFFQIIPEKENGDAEARDDRPVSSAGPA